MNRSLSRGPCQARLSHCLFGTSISSVQSYRLSRVQCVETRNWGSGIRCVKRVFFLQSYEIIPEAFSSIRMKSFFDQMPGRPDADGLRKFVFYSGCSQTSGWAGRVEVNRYRFTASSEFNVDSSVPCRFQFWPSVGPLESASLIPGNRFPEGGESGK